VRILLTNDDGIYAEGLCALYRALSLDHEVIIVAPEAERSAVGHAITLSQPLRVRVVRRGRDFWGYAVKRFDRCKKLMESNSFSQAIAAVRQG